MYKLLRAYRKLVNNRALPLALKNKVESIGLRALGGLFRDRHIRLQPYKIVVTRDVSITLFLDWQDYTDASFIFHRVWEAPNTNFVLRTLRDGDTAIDAGANVGYFAILMAKSARASRIVAIEPLRRNSFVLSKNLEANDVTNVSVERVALGEKEGFTTLKYRLLNSGSPSTVGFFGSDPVIDAFMMEETVPVKTIPQVFEEHRIQRCRLLKMDIQGAEVDALRSASGLLKEGRFDFLMAEYNPKSYGGADVVSLMGSYGYRAHALTAKGDLVPVESKSMRSKADYVFARSGQS